MTKFGYPVYGGRDSVTRSGLPTTPGSRCSASSTTSGIDSKSVTQRKSTKEKTWPLKPWVTDDRVDDGIVGWAKRQNAKETRKDIPATKTLMIPKKKVAILDTEYHISINHKCPNIGDLEYFINESLHTVHKPKPKPPPDEDTTVKLKYTKSKFGLITTSGFDENVENDDLGESAKRDIDSYRDSKHPDRNLDKIRESVDIQNKAQLERSNTYMKIKRLIKFSKNERRNIKNEDDEDEGYSSKTSSAEIKHATESDSEETDNRNLQRPEMQRMYSSMVNLSDLPSNAGLHDGIAPAIQDAKVVEEGANGRVKFSYTHQPTILQLPDPDVKLAHDSYRIEKRIESEDNNWSYAKLKRNKELNRCYPPEMLEQREESTVYNIDTMKPVTLILRKISIQNTDQIEPSVARWGRISPENAQNVLSNNLGLGTNPETRTSSVNKKESPAVSRPDSALSVTPVSPVPGSQRGTPRNVTPHCNTSRTPTGNKKPASVNRANSAVSQRELKHGLQRGNVRDVRVVNDGQPKEPMWNHHFSYVNKQTTDGQATNYSIGDLLPAVDKNIYSGHTVPNKFGQFDNETNRDEMTTTEILDISKNAIDDGYILLKKGMDLLTGSSEKLYIQDWKSTLGPPPFRPNQTRHPLMRNMTVVLSNRTSNGHNTNQPTGYKMHGLKSSSDRGPRHGMDEDVQTQRKLKEAFNQFYKNRPKEIGKEFRRMQTMWKT